MNSGWLCWSLRFLPAVDNIHGSQTMFETSVVKIPIMHPDLSQSRYSISEGTLWSLARGTTYRTCKVVHLEITFILDIQKKWSDWNLGSLEAGSFSDWFYLLFILAQAFQQKYISRLMMRLYTCMPPCRAGRTRVPDCISLLKNCI